MSRIQLSDGLPAERTGVAWIVYGADRARVKLYGQALTSDTVKALNRGGFTFDRASADGGRVWSQAIGLSSLTLRNLETFLHSHPTVLYVSSADLGGSPRFPFSAARQGAGWVVRRAALQ
jgi:hypothetical protein